MQINTICLTDVFTNAPGLLMNNGGTQEQTETFVKEKLSPIRGALDNANHRLSEVNRNANLSGEGKQNEFRKVASKTMEAIGQLEEAAQKTYAAFHSEQKKRLTLQDPQPKNEMLDYLQQQEVRDYLSDLDEKVVKNIYLDAIEKGINPLLVRAIENDPLQAINPMLNEQIIQQGRNRRVEMQHPEIIKEIKLVEAMSSLVTEAARKARQALTIQ